MEVSSWYTPQELRENYENLPNYSNLHGFSQSQQFYTNYTTVNEHTYGKAIIPLGKS